MYAKNSIGYLNRLLIGSIFCVFLVGCGGNSDNADISQPEAVVSLSESKYFPLQLFMSGADSTAGNNAVFVHHKITVTKLSNGSSTEDTQVFSKTITDNFDGYEINAYPVEFSTETGSGAHDLSGNYKVELSVQNSDGDTDSDVDFITLDGTINYATEKLDDTTSCTTTCAASTSTYFTGALVCTADTTSGCDSFALSDLYTLANTASDDTLGTDPDVIIVVVGGSGSEGGGEWPCDPGNNYGHGGVAQLQTSYDEFNTTYGTDTELYYFIGGSGNFKSDKNQGGAGGTATILTTADPDSTEIQITASGSYDSVNNNVLVLASGGGGGGACFGIAGDPGSGGSGGVAVDSEIVSGDDGGGNSGGVGGYDGTGGAGDTLDGDGSDGAGGYGGIPVSSNDCTGLDVADFINATPLLATNSDGSIAGNGGSDYYDDDCRAGAGGGGYGGGGAGGGDDSGGAGGGSYSEESTITSDIALTDDTAESYRGTSRSDGKLVIVFEAEQVNNH